MSTAAQAQLGMGMELGMGIGMSTAGRFRFCNIGYFGQLLTSSPWSGPLLPECQLDIFPSSLCLSTALSLPRDHHSDDVDDQNQDVIKDEDE